MKYLIFLITISTCFLSTINRGLSEEVSIVTKLPKYIIRSGGGFCDDGNIILEELLTKLENTYYGYYCIDDSRIGKKDGMYYDKLFVDSYILSKEYDKMNNEISDYYTPVTKGSDIHQPDIYKLQKKYFDKYFKLSLKQIGCGKYTQLYYLDKIDIQKTISKHVNVTVETNKQLKNIFPFPFFNGDNLSNISLDSLLKHIFNTTDINWSSGKGIDGKGSIINNSTEYIYTSGLFSDYFDIYTYKNNYEVRGKSLSWKIETNGKINNSKERNSRLNLFTSKDLFNNSRELGMGGKILSNNLWLHTTTNIGDTSFFPPLNNRHGLIVQEYELTYNLLDGILTSIIVTLPQSSTENGKYYRGNPLNEYNNDNLFNRFVKSLDKYYGTSKEYVEYLNGKRRNEKIKEWTNGDCKLLVKYTDFKGRRKISELVYVDLAYTNKYVELLMKKFIEKNMRYENYIEMEIYPFPYTLIRKGLYK